MENNNILPTSLAGPTDRLIACYPHLAPITSTWGSRQCRDFLAALAMDTRDGQRKGFPPEHASTIFRLLLAHDDAYPAFEVKTTTKWYELS